jgi:purine nucleosidase
MTPNPADAYALRRSAIRARDPRRRKVPVIPPPDQPIRLVIDTDARNEIDDLYAIALALLCPDRLRIQGFIAANYDNDFPGAGPASVEASADAIELLLRHAGMAGRYPIKLGSPPLQYQFEPTESEGVDFIIEQAMQASPQDPLWVLGLGAATNLASAYLKEPAIADRIVAFWHFRTEWPRRCWNFNVWGDVRAVRLIFHSDIPFVLFDTGTHLTCPMEQTARWAEWSPLGRFLHEFRFENPLFQEPTKGFFDLGDTAALVDPSLAAWETVPCPEVAWDLVYEHRNNRGQILRCKAIDRDRTFALLEAKLKGG